MGSRKEDSHDENDMDGNNRKHRIQRHDCPLVYFLINSIFSQIL